MNDDSEIKSYIKLKYFPIRPTAEWVDSLPSDVRRGIHLINHSELRPYSDDEVRTDILNLLALVFSTPSDKPIQALNIITEKLLEDYYTRHGFDYNEDGELPNG